MTPKEKKGVWIGGIAAIILALIFFSKCQLDLRSEESALGNLPRQDRRGV